jgi:hypothetical protein
MVIKQLFNSCSELSYRLVDRDLWEMVVPEACAHAHPEMPWACVLADFNLPYVVSDVFVVEMLLDNVQLFLHSG